MNCWPIFLAGMLWGQSATLDPELEPITTIADVASPKSTPGEPATPNAAVPSPETTNSSTTAPLLTPREGKRFSSLAESPKPASESSVPASEPPRSLPPSSTWWLSTAFGLVIVLAVIYGFGRALKKMAPGMSIIDGAGPIQLLYRSYLTPKQSVCLIRCGDRLLLIGLAGDRMNTLAEIDDPQEIDFLKGLCMQVRPKSATQAFRDIFKGKEKSLEIEPDEPASEPGAALAVESHYPLKSSEELSKQFENVEQKVLAWKVEGGR